jgi:heme-degrading monooxygenase HmoA
MAYFAVIFTSSLRSESPAYLAAAEEMLELASRMPGFLGLESVREKDEGITVSYWESLEAIEAWRRHPRHLDAKRMGKAEWYRRYRLRIARVEEPWKES